MNRVLPLALCALAITACNAEPVQDEAADTWVDAVTLGDDTLRVTFYDFGDAVALGVVESAEAAPTLELADAVDAADVWLAMGGAPADMPDFVADAPEGLAEGVFEVTPVPTASSEWDKKLLNRSCTLASDGADFDNDWANVGYSAFHWYYNGSSTYKSSPVFTTDQAVSHLCNYGVNGTDQVIHRLKGSRGTAWFLLSQSVPKGKRSEIRYHRLDNLDYRIYTTRLSDYYTQSGNYKMGIYGPN